MEMHGVKRERDVEKLKAKAQADEQKIADFRSNLAAANQARAEFLKKPDEEKTEADAEVSEPARELLFFFFHSNFFLLADVLEAERGCAFDE